MRSYRSRNGSIILAIAAGLGIHHANIARATEKTFDAGSSQFSLWSNPANWSPSPPTNGDSILALVPDNFQCTDDISGLTISSMDFHGGESAGLKLADPLECTGTFAFDMNDGTTLDLGGQTLTAPLVTMPLEIGGGLSTLTGGPSSGNIVGSLSIGNYNTSSDTTNALINGNYNISGNLLTTGAAGFTTGSPAVESPGVTYVNNLGMSLSISGGITNTCGLGTGSLFGSRVSFAGPVFITGLSTNSGAEVNGIGSSPLIAILDFENPLSVIGPLNDSGGALVQAVAGVTGGVVTVFGYAIQSGNILPSTLDLVGPQAGPWVWSKLFPNDLGQVINTLTPVIPFTSNVAQLKPLPTPGADDTYVTGDVQVTTGGLINFNFGSNTLHIGGQLVNSGSDTVIVSSSSAGNTTFTQASTFDLASPLQCTGNITNSAGAQMSLGSSISVGTINVAGQADQVASIINESGASLHFAPSSGGTMTVTGSITNTGSGTVMDLLGNVTIDGRSTPSPLLANNNGAVLNFNGNIVVGVADGIPAGNLDNTGGTINGLGGELTFSGGDQQNNGTINLMGTSVLSIGLKGTNTLTNFGALSAVGGTPAVNGILFNSIGATVSVSSGVTLTINSISPIQNSGGIMVTGMLPSGPITIPTDGSLPPSAGGGLLPGSTGSNGVQNGINNFGTINLSSGAIGGMYLINFAGATIAAEAGANGAITAEQFFNSPTGTVEAGVTTESSPGAHIPAGSGGTLTIGSASVSQAGLILIGPGATVTITNSPSLVNLTTGKIDGDGTLDVSQTSFANDGVIGPGMAGQTSLLDIIGNVSSGSSSQLAFSLDGIVAGTGYDQLDVSGGVTLAGSLDVFLGSFAPTYSESFTVLTGTSVSGVFSNVTPLTSTTGELNVPGGEFEVLYNPTSVVLTHYVSVPEPSALYMASAVASVLLARRSRKAGAPGSGCL